MSIIPDHYFCTCTIIGKKYYQSITKYIHRLKLINYAAYFLIHTLDHCGMNGHFIDLKLK